MTPIFIEMDLVQAEWVVTAYYSRDAHMLYVVRTKVDPHLRTGSLISGAPELLISQEDDLIGHLTDPVEIKALREEKLPDLKNYFTPRNMSIRQGGKKSNHGFNYDMGPNTFALTNGMDQSDGQRCHKAYHRAYPGLQTMYARIAHQLNKDRTLTNCFGDKRRFLDRWSDDLLKVAYSFIPQSTVVRVVNLALVDAYRDVSSLMHDVDPRAQVHDSVLFHARVEDWIHASAIAIRLERYFLRTCRYHGEEFTIDVEAKVGKNWGVMEKVKDVHSPTQMQAAYERACVASG